MNILKKLHYFILLSLFALVSCSEDEQAPDESADDRYVIMTATAKWDAGYFTTYSEFPEGPVEKINDQSLQIGTAFRPASCRKRRTLGPHNTREDSMRA